MTLMRRLIVFLIAGLVIAAVVGIYYMPQWQQTQAATKGGRRGSGGFSTEPVPVLVTAARAADVPVHLDGVGTARALNTVIVRPQVDGKLIEVSFTEGQDVPKGFVLAKIDPTTYQAQYDQTVAKKAQNEALLANARLDLERYVRLAQSNAVNKQQLDTQKSLVQQLEAQVKADQAAIDNARAILSYTDIVAPIAGRTGIRIVDEGNLVRASDAGIVVITQIRPIAVFFNLPQQELPDLNKGLSEGPLPVEAFGTDSRKALDQGKVLVIDNQVDQTTGTVKLKAEFPNADLQLWPGQFVNVRVLIDTLRQVVVVPTAAVQRGPNGTFVYVLRDEGTVSVRPVTLTQQNDVQAVVAAGLHAGERVVTTGFARLTEGTAVTASRAEDAGQIAPGDRPRPDGTRGKRVDQRGEKAKRHPGSGRPPVSNP
jgi:multidrug efflux system membrane fusion protein